MLTVYGSTKCSNCKSLLKFAERLGVPVDYKLIDKDPEAYNECMAHVGGRASLPVVVWASPEMSKVTTGSTAGIALVSLYKETSK